MSKKILILGAKSGLGKEISKAFKSKKFKLRKISRSEIDYLKINNLKKILNKFHADYVINCAAITDKSKCDKNYELTKFVNGFFPIKVANILLKKNIFFIHFSTDLVFNNKLLPSNLVKTNPKTTYAKSKLIAEKIYKKKNCLVIRLPQIIGLRRKDFFSEVFSSIKKKKITKVYSNYYFTPIFYENIIKFLHNYVFKNKKKNLFKENKIIQLSNNNLISKYDFIKKYLTFHNKKYIKKDKLDKKLLTGLKSNIKLNYNYKKSAIKKIYNLI
ncbi:MAG: hypothetical protein CBE33_04100 [Candidatus Pelagibacter sp. TMED273]|nr:MAG: hypothetical protein CBE33_04100 [Candidatus Pelagibacter sp. TMED273]|tara:strand:+ start:2385 stop:3200 length:816 start_codon:yes stop_codon:yes gene_type:complete